MTDKHRRRRSHRPPHRTATRGPHRPLHPERRPAPSAEENPLFGVLRGALRAPDPIEFWVAAAPIVTIVEEPGELADALPEGVDLLQSFIDVDVAETTALLHMVATISSKDLLRARARRALASRRQPLPAHLTELGDAQVEAARVFGDGHGDNHMVELALPGAIRATLVLYVTRVPHLYLKDAFVMSLPLERVEEHFARSMAAEGFRLEDAVQDLAPVHSRAALEDALAGIRPDVAKVAEEGDQWPMLRSFVDYVLSLMPAGGEGYDGDGLLVGRGSSYLVTDSGPRFVRTAGGEPLPEAPLGAHPGEDDGGGAMPWIAEDGTNLAESFLASDQAAGLDPHPLHAPLVQSLMALASGLEGDPLAWEVDAAPWIVQELLPVDPIMPEAAFDLVPSVLPALVAWSHEVTGTEASETADVLEALAPPLAALPARRSDPGNRAERWEMALGMALESEDPAAFHRVQLAMRAGGFEELAALGTAPLPAEPLDLGAIPDNLHERARKIDEHLVAGLDRLGDDMPTGGETVLGTEFLTACRRFLVQIASRGPEALRRRASTRNTALAIAWVLGRGNDLVGPLPAPIASGDLQQAFEARSAPSQRAQTLMRAAVLPQSPMDVALGSADLLVASAREQIIAERDRESIG